MINTILRHATFITILVVGVWFLKPPQEDQTDGSQEGVTNQRSSAQYVIKINPGQQYMPNTVPYGIGRPLQGMKEVIREFEKQFPDTRVEVLAVPGVREYLVTQLSSGRAPDIVNVNVEDVWIDVQKGWYVPLDPYLEKPNQFVYAEGDPEKPGYDQWWDMFKYQAISRGKAAPDGLNYCLSFDMVETGIFYNKDIFRSVGATPPNTWEEFIATMELIKKSGTIPMLMSIDWFNDWCVDLFFDQLYFPILPGIDLVQDPIREEYLEGYLDWDEVCFLYQKGFFSKKDPRYLDIWECMYRFRQYCNSNLSSTDFLREFVTGKAAMIWNASPLTYRLAGDRKLEFDWGIFYLPPFVPGKTSQYAGGVDMCVIGGAGTQLEVTNSAYDDTGDPATSTKLERVIALLQFLTYPQNYVKIVNEYPGFLPNIVGVPVLPSLKPFEEILKRRYTTTKWTFTFDLKFTEIQRRMLELYLNDGISLNEFMDWQVQNMDAATSNLLLRKDINLDKLEDRWNDLAPLRTSYKGIPTGNE